MALGHTFSVYLRALSPGEIEFRQLDDGRYWLDITDEVALILRPDDLAIRESIEGLNALAASCVLMSCLLADAVSSLDAAPPPGTSPDAP